MKAIIRDHIWYLSVSDSSGRLATAFPVTGGRWRCVPERAGVGRVVDSETDARLWLAQLADGRVAA